MCVCCTVFWRRQQFFFIQKYKHATSTQHVTRDIHPWNQKKKKTLGVILPRNCMWCVWMGSSNIFLFCFLRDSFLSLSHFLWFDHLIVVTFVYLFDTMNQSLFDYLLQWISHSQKKIESTGGQLNINTLVKIFVFFFLIKFHISQSKYRSIWSTKRKIYLFHS